MVNTKNTKTTKKDTFIIESSSLSSPSSSSSKHKTNDVNNDLKVMNETKIENTIIENNNVNISNPEIEKKKRGRKKQDKSEKEDTNICSLNNMEDNNMNNNTNNTISNEVVKPKRQRKSNKSNITDENNVISDSNVNQTVNQSVNQSVNDIMNDNNEIVKKKRGKKKNSDIINESNSNININITESNNKENKKVYKKKLNEKLNENINNCEENNGDNNSSTEKSLSTATPQKKRGRKPKGGKIITQQLNDNNNDHELPNIILHMKCSLSDLNNQKMLSDSNYDASIDGVQCYNSSDIKGSEFTLQINDTQNSNNIDIINNNHSIKNNNTNFLNIPTCNSTNNSSCNDTNNKLSPRNIKYTPCIIDIDKNKEPNNQTFFNSQVPLNYNSSENNTIFMNENDATKEIWKKINQLKVSFHKSDIFQNSGGTQRSACFWCTCDFDSPPIYIPKYIVKDTYNVYGCFCSPECAAAYLMNENIDTSIRFERYHLLNSLYGKIYKYEKSIKIAPNPYYLLNKFYGNLSITEYRKLFKSDQMIYVVNKPLTHILPELYEDNNDFLLNNKIIPQNTMNIKSNRPQIKNNIINEAFGISVNG